MVHVECVLIGQIREDVGERSLHVETDGQTVGELLRELAEVHEALGTHLFEGDGFADDVIVTRNERHVRHQEGTETPLEDGDVIRITQAFYGG